MSATKIGVNTNNILNCFFLKLIYTLAHQTKYLHMGNLLLMNSIFLVFSSKELQRRLIQLKVCYKFYYSVSKEASHHSHKKWKDSLETRAVLLIFFLELEITTVIAQSIYQNSKKWWLCEEFLSEIDFETLSHFLLLWLWCRHFCGSSEYRCRSKRVSQMLLMCYNLLQSQNILMNQWHIRRAGPETQYPGTGTPKWDMRTRTRDSICGTHPGPVTPIWSSGIRDRGLGTP